MLGIGGGGRDCRFLALLGMTTSIEDDRLKAES
jgi:hypothetical protein